MCNEPIGALSTHRGTDQSNHNHSIKSYEENNFQFCIQSSGKLYRPTVKLTLMRNSVVKKIKKNLRNLFPTSSVAFGCHLVRNLCPFRQVYSFFIFKEGYIRCLLFPDRTTNQGVK